MGPVTHTCTIKVVASTCTGDGIGVGVEGQAAGDYKFTTNQPKWHRKQHTCKTIYRVANLAQIQQITCIESLSLPVAAVSHGSFGNPNWADTTEGQ